MINPNMGTMLVYLFIEPYISKNNLKKLINENLDNTFNAITVDSDTSTSDTLALFSLDQSKINLNTNKNFNIVSSAISAIMKDLSLQVVKDGEGLTKLVQVNILKASSKNQAKKIAFSIANSPLVKTAISGQDANWGRIIMAIGKTQEKIQQNKIKISFGSNILCEKGSIYKKINYKKISNYMKNNIVIINVELGLGNDSFTVHGNDLTHEYIRINGDYRS